MICFKPKPSQSFFVYRIQSKENFFFFTEKELFKEKGEWWTEKKTKRRLFNSPNYGNKEGTHNVNKKAC